MKWFQLEADAYRNPDLRQVVEEFGVEGFGRYIILLCLVAEGVGEKNLNFDLRLNDGSPVPLRQLSRECRTNVQKFLDFCQKLSDASLIDPIAWKNEKRIAIPNMAKRLDEYTRRVRTLSGQTTAYKTIQDKTRQKDMGPRDARPPSQDKKPSLKPENWPDFIQHRIELKKPLTPSSEEASARRLWTLSSGNKFRAAAIVDQTLERGWLGFWNLKDDALNAFLASERDRIAARTKPCEYCGAQITESGRVHHEDTVCPNYHRPPASEVLELLNSVKLGGGE
jgi:hypothetical protein